MPDHNYWDTFLGADIGLIDPDTDGIIGYEEERQARKLIMIPSESIAPLAVRQALGSVFNNVYAEGYPPLRMTRDEEETILDASHQLAYYRRYADRRFYKGVDYVNLVETLAQRRAALIFANERVSDSEIYVNIQPLSGAAANLAVYDTVVDPGDTVMGMDLYQGGHLTHGSEFNFSGKRYHVVSYGVSKSTGRLDYDEIRELARKHRPRMLIGGFTSYTWAPDWGLFRAIADEVGAVLLADISHAAGMATAGAYPNPMGIADVITCTTHKTLCGPRGAIIMTTDEDLARRIDLAVFPGEQGGPHTQKFAGMAVAFKIAASKPFQRMMWQIKENAAALAEGLSRRGLKLAYGGTDTHFCMLDLNSVKSKTGFPLRGEPAVRILDMAGIVANKNTIPGDTSTGLGMGIRLGTPWLTQRGFGKAEIDEVARLIHKTVTAIQPFSYTGLAGELPRGKIDFDTFEEIKAEVAALAAQGASETQDRGTGYPHFLEAKVEARAEVEDKDRFASTSTSTSVLLVSGERAVAGLAQIVTSDVAALQPGEHQLGFILDPDGRVMDEVSILRLTQDECGRDRFIVEPTPASYERVKAWLRGLGDGYILFDRADLFAKVEGPLVVEEVSAEQCLALGAEIELSGGSPAEAMTPGLSAVQLHATAADHFELRKPYFVGQHALAESRSRPQLAEFHWEEPKEAPLKRTRLYDWHRAHTKHIVPFAGWEMPVWYTGVLDEHSAIRKAAGLFDVSHMGVFEASGPHAEAFLDLVCTNYTRWYAPGESFYSYLLDPDGQVIDDLLVYRRNRDRFQIVVNASNADKDWAWLNAVNNGEVLLDRERPDLRVLRPAVLRDLKDPASGRDMRIDLALQGPASLKILQSLTDDPRLKARLARVRKTGVTECVLDGFDLVIARTGYTGEEMGFELFVHPDRAVAFWEALLEAGKPFGLQPTGLAARDSTRTEAGLPLYGHELAGHFDISPAGARFAGYVKLHKPYFIGRSAYMRAEQARTMEVARFRVNDRGVRMPKTGDPVVNKKGQAIGYVTSAAVDVDGIILGLAYVQSRYAKPGDEIGIFNVPAKPVVEKPNKADLAPGDKVSLPDAATLLPRFPDKAERAHWRA
jgi:glycine hydroxymethyltransferase